MRIWKVILVTLVIFATGAITGGLLARRASSEPHDRAGRAVSTNRLHQGFRPERMLRMEFINRARKELALTPHQMDQIEVIISESQSRTRALWEDFSPQMRAEVKAAQLKIRELLTPEQRAQFEEIIRKRRPSRRGDWERRELDPDITRTNPPLAAE